MIRDKLLPSDGTALKVCRILQKYVSTVVCQSLHFFYCDLINDQAIDLSILLHTSSVTTRSSRECNLGYLRNDSPMQTFISQLNKVMTVYLHNHITNVSYECISISHKRLLYIQIKFEQNLFICCDHAFCLISAIGIRLLDHPHEYFFCGNISKLITSLLNISLSHST